MKIFAVTLILVVNFNCCFGQGKKTKCLSSPTLDAKVEKYIKVCQEEVKTNIIEDVFFAGSEDKHHEQVDSEEYYTSEVDYTDIRNPFRPERPRQSQRIPTQTLKYEEFELSPEDERKAALKWHRRMKRQARPKVGATRRSDYHPTTISNEDKFVAGCLMQCIYRKNKAVDIHGYPTLQGLVELYTDGINEQKFFVSTLKSVDKCLKGMSLKNNIRKDKVPTKGEVCELAFDVFDCVSDSITEYCSE